MKNKKSKETEATDNMFDRLEDEIQKLAQMQNAFVYFLNHEPNEKKIIDKLIDSRIDVVIELSNILYEIGAAYDKEEESSAETTKSPFPAS